MILKYPTFNTTINVSLDEATTGGKKSRRDARRKNREKIQEVNPVATEEKDKSTENAAQENVVKKNFTQDLLMVKVENVTHEKFRHTEEVKVILFL